MLAGGNGGGVGRNNGVRGEGCHAPEFKTFAFRGNLLDLAVGVILGLAFIAVVQSLVDGVFMQLIAAVGQPDFSRLAFDLGGTRSGTVSSSRPW